MSARRVFGFVVALAMSCCGFSQQVQTDNGAGVTAHAAGVNHSHQDLLRRIAAEEAAARQAEAAHATELDLARLYWNLGISYGDAGQWGLSEAALTRSLSMFRRVAGDDRELATAFDSLAVLHITMGKLRESAKEEQESLRLREKLGDRLQLARSWNTLAALSLKQHKYEKARDFAEQAIAEFAVDKKSDEIDRVSSRYSLGMALCSLNDCVSALPVLKAGIDEARSASSAHDFPLCFGEFLLGYAYWKAGDMANAGREMQTGLTGMNDELGWKHPAYVAALGLYAKYLHQAKEVEAADDVERQIRQAEAVVDVHTLQSGQAALGFDGLR